MIFSLIEFKSIIVKFYLVNNNNVKNHILLIAKFLFFIPNLLFNILLLFIIKKFSILIIKLF